MNCNNSTIIIIIVAVIILFLLWSQFWQPRMTASKITQPQPQPQQVAQQYMPRMTPTLNTETFKNTPYYSDQEKAYDDMMLQHGKPIIANINIEHDHDHNHDPYADPIKKQDMYTMFDPLSYPQKRLPREILEKYEEYRAKNGSYPPFNEMTNPMFDNPIMVGYLVKTKENDDIFNNTTPTAIPLMMVKSVKNTNRFFYYIVDQSQRGKIHLKIPLDNVKINGSKYNNSEFSGLPELYEGDIIENINIYPGEKFKIHMYKTPHFP